MSKLDRDLAALPAMAAPELRTRWIQMGEGTPPNAPSSVLRHLLAQRLQERRLGALPALARRELIRLADGRSDKELPAPRAKLAPGTRLVREWNGRTISVDVLEQGFAFDNRTWRSLSEIARHVTGAHWSGPRFFGLRHA